MLLNRAQWMKVFSMCETARLHGTDADKFNAMRNFAQLVKGDNNGSKFQEEVFGTYHTVGGEPGNGHDTGTGTSCKGHEGIGGQGK